MSIENMLNHHFKYQLGSTLVSLSQAPEAQISTGHNQNHIRTVKSQAGSNCHWNDQWEKSLRKHKMPMTKCIMIFLLFSHVFLIKLIKSLKQMESHNILSFWSILWLLMAWCFSTILTQYQLYHTSFAKNAWHLCEYTWDVIFNLEEWHNYYH